MGMFRRTAPTFFAGVGRCAPTVFLDGREVPIEVVQDLPLSLLEGVEFWPGIGPPDSRFRARPTPEGVPKLCGVLLVWSRPGGEGWHPPSIGRLAGAVVGAVVLWLVAR